MSMNIKTEIKIGHSSYMPWSNNHLVLVTGYAAALAELLSRNITMQRAHAALQQLKTVGYCSGIGTRNGNPVEISQIFSTI